MWTCTICYQPFTRKNNCVKHEKTCTGPRVLKCDFCGEVFPDKYRKYRHKNKCPGAKDGAEEPPDASDDVNVYANILDFVITSTQSVLDHITSSPEAQTRLRAAFERGCLHEELLRLTHYAGPAENRNVISIDTKGPYMKVLQDGKQLVMNTTMGVQMIINRNISLSAEPVVMGVLGIEEPALQVATTPRQKTYESLQIRAVIANAGEYVMPSRAFVQEVVEKPTRIAWSTRTRNCVAAQQGWQCNVCDDLLTDCYDIDHRVPLFKGGADAFSNLQALCVPCHRNKTAAERSKQPILLPTT